MVLSDLVDALNAAGITLEVRRGRLGARPRPPGELAVGIAQWRDFLLWAHASHRNHRSRIAPYACTHCRSVTLTQPTRRSIDGRKVKAGPDCRFTPGCEGRHDALVAIPWGDG